MSVYDEICCQCENPTRRAGRGNDSLYTDNDLGPYCEDCWQDGDYWRTLAEEGAIKTERLRTVIDRALSLITKVTGIIDKRAGPTLPTASVRSNWRAMRLILDVSTSADNLLAKLSPDKLVMPHQHQPSALHMGDCGICGHVAASPIHTSPERTSESGDGE